MKQVAHHFLGYLNGHLKSTRLDFVWAEWVPNTFLFCNLSLE